MMKIGQRLYFAPIGCPIFRFFEVDFSTLNLGVKIGQKTGVQIFFWFLTFGSFSFLRVKGRYGVKISSLLDYVDIILYFQKILCWSQIWLTFALSQILFELWLIQDLLIYHRGAKNGFSGVLSSFLFHDFSSNCCLLYTRRWFLIIE